MRHFLFAALPLLAPLHALAQSTQIEESAVQIPQARTAPLVARAPVFDDVVPPESGPSWQVHPVEVGYMWSLGMRAEMNNAHDVSRNMWRGLKLSIYNPSILHTASVRIRCGDESPLPFREATVGKDSFATVPVAPEGDEDPWRGVRFEYGTSAPGGGRIAVAECAVYADRPIMVAAIVTEIVRESALHNSYQQGPSRNDRGYDASQKPPIQQSSVVWPAFRLRGPSAE